MFVYEHQLRVRYGDTDQMGYVYYGNYGYYYEQARAEAIRSIGITYKQIEESGTIMPITRMNVKYIQPALYDELLTIKTIVPHLPNRIIIFKYEIYNSKSVLINEGETHLVFADIQSKRIKTAPALLLDKLKSFF
jgi:acyl-CoA thioester hydrolase